MRGKGEISGSAAVALATVGKIPLCRKIALFLLRNSGAADTARGIAEWWIQEDLQATQMALDRLLEAGIVRVRSKGGMTFYSLSGNRTSRRCLRKMLRQSVGDGRNRPRALSRTGQNPAG